MAKQHDTPEPQLAKSSTCHERHIKVCRMTYERPKNYPPNKGNPSVPWIQMKGYWLAQAGFAIDTPIKVRVMNGCLVLTVEQLKLNGWSTAIKNTRMLAHRRTQ